MKVTDGQNATAGARCAVGNSRLRPRARRRRHQEMFALSAVRTTHAAGAGCLPTVRHDA
jgi:hypothetical protein